MIYVLEDNLELMFVLVSYLRNLSTEINFDFFGDKIEYFNHLFFIDLIIKRKKVRR